VTKQVLHADFIALGPGAGAQTRAGLVDEARTLARIEPVEAVVAIETDEDGEYDLALFFVLRDFASLEPFGTDERYSRFLQGRVAPVLRGLAGADVQLEGGFPRPSGRGACLALAAPPETYDWEVRTALTGWTGGLDESSGVIGLAVGERQRFRGLAICFGEVSSASVPPAHSRLGAVLIAGKAHQL
jgi:hypothetical protein